MQAQKFLEHNWTCESLTQEQHLTALKVDVKITGIRVVLLSCCLEDLTEMHKTVETHLSRDQAELRRPGGSVRLLLPDHNRLGRRRAVASSLVALRTTAARAQLCSNQQSRAECLKHKI